MLRGLGVLERLIVGKTSTSVNPSPDRSLRSWVPRPKNSREDGGTVRSLFPSYGRNHLSPTVPRVLPDSGGVSGRGPDFPTGQ